MAKEQQDSAFTSVFKSVWGVLAVIVTIISLAFGLLNYIYKTFPTNEDLSKFYISKQEYFQGEPYGKKVMTLTNDIAKLQEESRRKDEELNKRLKEELTKLRIEYRSERLRDILSQLKIIDEKLLTNPNDRSLQSYREMLCKEYDRVQKKLDNNLKDLEQ